ncbi:MAG: hypothetical protein J0M04_00405 [Verrucomicrobia bacterium]|nr:hypothetical protein [Verrucomicrobiota bacterium]
MDTRIVRRFRLAACLALSAALALSGTSCTTTYDYYGRPVQSVDPGMAAAGIAAAGLIGYAIGQNNRHHHGHCGPRGGSHTSYGVSVGGGYPGGYGYGGYYGGGY